MADISLKLKIGETEIDLQGDSEVVERIFIDMKTNGLGQLNSLEKNNQKIKESVDIETNIGSEEIEVIPNDNKSITQNKNGKKAKVDKRKPATFTKKSTLIDLGLKKDEILEMTKFFKSFKVTSVQDQCLVLMYWYNKYKGSQNFEESFSEDLLFSLFHNVGVKQTANINQILLNAVNRTPYISKNAEIKKEYILSVHGEKYIEDLMQEGNN